MTVHRVGRNYHTVCGLKFTPTMRRSLSYDSVTCEECRNGMRHQPAAGCPRCRSTNIKVAGGQPERAVGHPHNPTLLPGTKPQGECLDCGWRWTVGGRSARSRRRSRRRQGLTSGQQPATLEESTPTPKEEPVSKCPYPGCTFEGTDAEVDDHRTTTVHDDEAQAGSNES